ncbi:MAG: hypothetical protein J6B86_02075 [Clostridia bacterium]|nr:hypothetical protein [Clostridia bacterium]
MKKKIVAVFLLTILSVSMILTGCSKPVMTAKGEDMKAGYYSFYVHWQRDYYKELLKGYNYDITAVIDNYYTETETVRESIINTAKSQYLTFVVVSEKFEELGLSLTEQQQADIEKQYAEEWVETYGESGMKKILKTLGLKQEEFLNLLSVEYKSDAILEYYYGENGVTPITEQDKKDYYNENYYRFKYILFTTVDENDKALPADEIANKRNLAETICNDAKNGASFEDLVAKHSEDYVKITDDMSAEDKASAEESNEDSVTVGLICDNDGIFNQTLYTYYDICVNQSIIKQLDSMSIGDVSVVEIDNSIWVVKKYDVNEDASYFEDRKDSIYQKMYGDDFNNKYTLWLAELDYTFNKEVIEELDPKNFTDLFSEVYNLQEEN